MSSNYIHTKTIEPFIIEVNDLDLPEDQWYIEGKYLKCQDNQRIKGARLRRFDCDHSAGDCVGLDIYCENPLDSSEFEYIGHGHVPEGGYYEKAKVWSGGANGEWLSSRSYNHHCYGWCSPESAPNTYLSCLDGESFLKGMRFRDEDGELYFYCQDLN